MISFTFEDNFMGHIYLIFALWFAIVVGWILNIVQLIALLANPITGIVILKIIGIFVFPFGSVLGYIALIF